MIAEPQIYQTLNLIFRDVFDDPSIVLRPEMSAADIPEWDSLNHINIIVASEARFGVKFKTGEVDGLANVGQFAKLIEEKLSR